jgi:hypothetical protein
MITPDQAREAERSKAGDDLLDIAALRNSTPFTRYWLRHLTRKRDSVRDQVLNDPPEKCPPAEREILRRIMKAYDDLLEMPTQHETAARALLDPPARPDAKIDAAMERAVARRTTPWG